MITIILLALCIYLIWKFSNVDKLKSEPPTLPGKLPFIGHGHKYLGNSVEMFNSIREMQLECERIGGAAILYLGPTKFYVISDPGDCLTVSNECLDKHYVYDFLKPVFENGILICDVPTWKKNRKLLNPAFNQQVLDGFIEIFNHYSKNLVEEFSTELGKPFDHEKYLRHNNLKTICTTSFGLNAEELGNLKIFLKCTDEAIHAMNERITKFWYHSDFIYNLSPLKRTEKQVAACLNNFADTILQRKRAEKKLNSNAVNAPGSPKPFMDLILDLADNNPSLTDNQIRAEISTVVAGGHDTSATLLTFALTVLGSFPRVQEKAYQEVVRVLGDSRQYIEKYDLSKLNYIEAVLKETLRLYPIVPIVVRQIKKNIKLKNCTLRAGYGCMIHIYGTLRHPIWGPDPHEFRPERWLEKDSLPPPKYYAAFSLGQRSCIGKLYAMMSMKITLAHILRRYIISSDINNMIINMKTLIRPDSGFHITLKKRE